MFGKVMSISDDLMPTYFELCTDVPMEEIESMSKSLAAGDVHPMDLKKRLAREIVTIYHSAQDAADAQAEFEKVFSNREVPTDMPLFELAQADLENGKAWIVKLLVGAGMAPSNSEARRLVQQGGVTLDGEKVTDPRANLEVKDGQVLRAGKLKFAEIRII